MTPMERDALIARHMPLVRKIVGSRYPRLSHDLQDDLIQEGYVGLCKAADGYDADKGTAFSTYAYRRIAGAMLDHLRVCDPLTRGMRKTRGDNIQVEVSSDAMMPVEGALWIESVEQMQYMPVLDAMIRRESSDREMAVVRRAARTSPGPSGQALRLYIEEMSGLVIARDQGVPLSSAIYLIQCGIKRVRKMMRERLAKG